MALNWPLEQEGDTGENVRSIQYLLNARITEASSTAESAVTSTLTGAAPEEATEAPASATMTEAPPAGTATATGVPLAVDGIFGPKTAAAVRAFQAVNGLLVDGKVGNQTWPVLIIEVSAGSTGDAVRAVQSQLNSRSGWLAIDGIFGPQTDNVVHSFQSFCELTTDGIVGPNTWNRLTLAYVRANNGQAAAELVYQAWTKNDRGAAAYEAIPVAVEQLFAKTWKTGWTFAGCQGAAGTFICTWQRTGEQLILAGNDSTGAPFYYVNNVTFQA
jgi:peptidoglycan hydrolase-like protein with peptidoglycan-binding domain